MPCKPLRKSTLKFSKRDVISMSSGDDDFVLVDKDEQSPAASAGSNFDAVIVNYDSVVASPSAAALPAPTGPAADVNSTAVASIRSVCVFRCVHSLTAIISLRICLYSMCF